MRRIAELYRLVVLVGVAVVAGVLPVAAMACNVGPGGG